jgi:hypothetical protein
MVNPTLLLCQVLRGEAGSITWEAVPPSTWERLPALARFHGVAPLVCHAFAAGWPAAIPAAVRRSLEAAAYGEIANTLMLRRALPAILAAAAPIAPIVLLKGAALAEDLYERPTLRPLTDLDLLVPEQHAEAVTRAVAALGYQAVPTMAPGLEHAINHHTALFGGSGGGTHIEIHWGLVAGSADWRAAPVEWFWTQTEPMPAAPTAGVLRLTPSALLLHLAAHLVLQHAAMPARLIWIYDIHLLVSSCAIDWELLGSQACTLGWHAAVRAALDQAHACFGTPIPNAAIRVLSATAPTRRSSRRAGLPTRARVAVRQLLPHADYMRWRYPAVPEPLLALAHPYRWLAYVARRLENARSTADQRATRR